MGSTYAAVLPEPVLERAVKYQQVRHEMRGGTMVLPSMSLPSRARGMAWAWTGVGVENFWRTIPCSRRASRPRPSNEGCADCWDCAEAATTSASSGTSCSLSLRLTMLESCSGVCALTHLRRRYFLDSPDSSVLALSHRPRTTRVSTPPTAAFRVSSAVHLTARSVLRSAIRFDS